MRTASVTATITGSGPERWVHSDVTIRPGIPRFAIHGVCKDAAIEIRHMVRSVFDKAGKSMPSGTITADMDFDVPFEGIPELSITLATAILLASGQLSPDKIEGITFRGWDGAVLRLRSSSDFDEACLKHGIEGTRETALHR